jgi:SdpI/YfhL protein family
VRLFITILGNTLAGVATVVVAVLAFAFAMTVVLTVKAGSHNGEVGGDLVTLARNYPALLPAAVIAALLQFALGFCPRLQEFLPVTSWHVGEPAHKARIPEGTSCSRIIFTRMDVKLALAAYILPGLGIVLGIPIALGLIPPNRFYGYRTRKTFSSADIWYRANRFCGWAMTISGAVALFHNALFLQKHRDWSSPTLQLVLTISSSVLLFLGLIVSAFYVRKL